MDTDLNYSKLYNIARKLDISDIEEREELVKIVRNCLNRLNDVYQEYNGKIFDIYKGNLEQIACALGPISETMMYILNEFFIKYNLSKEDNFNNLYRELNLDSYNITYYTIDRCFSDKEVRQNDSLCSLALFILLCRDFLLKNPKSYNLNLNHSY